MNRLNAWVRSTGVSRPRKAVYWLKSRYVIRDAAMAGMLAHVRYVCATVKCNRCVNGIYLDWEGHARGQCYQCNGQGLVTLKFVETMIDNVGIWHTPLGYSNWHGWPMDDLEPTPLTDWTPGREGIELDIEEAAGHLNVVEEFYPFVLNVDRYARGPSSPWENSRDEYDSTHYYLFNYGFEFKNPETKECFNCGKPKTHHCCSIIPPGLQVSYPVCDICGSAGGIWDLIAEQRPPAMGPNLTIWYKRHLAAFASIWGKTWNMLDKEWPRRIKRPA